MCNQKYNGWNSKETWQVGLWFDNFPGDEWDFENPSNMQDQIEEILWESIGVDPDKTVNCMTDLISHALAGVDWRELYDSWAEDRESMDEEE